MCHKRASYTSDLTDEQWAWIRQVLPVERSGPGRPLELDIREGVNAIFYIVKTGCQWANLPHDFPHYQSVYYHFRKWCKDGTWERINRALRYELRHRAGRSPHPSAAIMDSQSVTTTPVGGPRGYDAAKKVRGRKRHLLVDTQGNVLTIAVLPADIQDAAGARILLPRLSAMLRLRVQKIWADYAYRGSLFTWCYEQFRITLDIVKPPPRPTTFGPLPKRWIVERTFAWLGNFRRLSKDYEQRLSSSEGFIYLASIQRMLRHVAA